VPRDGIQALPDEGGGSSGGVLAGLLSNYELRGYERGYRRAVEDLLASLVWATEEFLRSQPQSSDEAPVASAKDRRRLLYEFEEKLEHRIHSLSPDAGYVSDGLGI
jgi:hypothetical protein